MFEGTFAYVLLNICIYCLCIILNIIQIQFQKSWFQKRVIHQTERDNFFKIHFKIYSIENSTNKIHLMLYLTSVIESQLISS